MDPTVVKLYPWGKIAAHLHHRLELRYGWIDKRHSSRNGWIDKRQPSRNRGYEPLDCNVVGPDSMYKAVAHDQIKLAWAEGKSLVVLIGPPGSGKSYTAYQLSIDLTAAEAYQQRPLYQVIYLPLAFACFEPQPGWDLYDLAIALYRRPAPETSREDIANDGELIRAFIVDDLLLSNPDKEKAEEIIKEIIVQHLKIHTRDKILLLAQDGSFLETKLHEYFGLETTRYQQCELIDPGPISGRQRDEERFLSSTMRNKFPAIINGISAAEMFALYQGEEGEKGWEGVRDWALQLDTRLALKAQRGQILQGIAQFMSQGEGKERLQQKIAELGIHYGPFGEHPSYSFLLTYREDKANGGYLFEFANFFSYLCTFAACVDQNKASLNKDLAPALYDILGRTAKNPFIADMQFAICLLSIMRYYQDNKFLASATSLIGSHDYDKLMKDMKETKYTNSLFYLEKLGLILK